MNWAALATLGVVFLNYTGLFLFCHRPTRLVSFASVVLNHLLLALITLSFVLLLLRLTGTIARQLYLVLVFVLLDDLDFDTS